LAPRHNRRTQRYASPRPSLVSGEKLRSLRLSRLLSQRKLDIASGVSVETINRIENAGEPRRTAAITVRKLARALGVDPHEPLNLE
jgi:transcriptional regulator with XRE-family HTH domain